MKKLLFVFLLGVLVINEAAALNIDFIMTPITNEVYENESVLVELNITNYEVSFTANNVKAIVKIDNRNETINFGTIAPGMTSTRNLSLGEFEAGTYKLENYVEYDIIGMTSRSQVKYQELRVLPSKPIIMKAVSLQISQIELSENPSINNDFSIKFTVTSSVDSAYIKYGLTQEASVKEMLTEGSNDFKIKYNLESPGTYVFEVRAYDKTEGESLLKAYETGSFVLVDPSKFKTIEFEPIILKKGNVSIEVSTEPKKDLVQDVGCFFIGGCKGDIYAPIVTIDKVLTQGDITYYLFTADDSTTGDSSITGCEINVGKSGWSPVNISYNNSRIQGNYSTEANIADFTVELKCVDSSLNTGYTSIGVKQEFDVLIITNEDKLNKTNNYDAVINEFLTSLETDGLSGAYIDLDDERTLSLFGIDPGAYGPKDIKNVINIIVSKKNTRYLIILGDQNVIPSIAYRSNGKTISFDDPYADLTGDGVADISLSRILSGSDSTESIEQQITAFSALHSKQAPVYAVTVKSKATSSGNFLERLGDTVCGNFILKNVFYGACTTIAPGPGLLICQGACFIVSNHETISRLGTAVTTGNLSIVQETIEDGSLISMVGDGLEIASTADLIDTAEYKSGINFLQNFDKVVSTYQKYNQQYGALRSGDLVLEAKKSGMTGVSPDNANIEDLYGLSLEMINGDPTLRVEVKNE